MTPERMASLRKSADADGGIMACYLNLALDALEEVRRQSCFAIAKSGDVVFVEDDGKFVPIDATKARPVGPSLLEQSNVTIVYLAPGKRVAMIEAKERS